MNDTQKKQRLRQMKTSALQNILNTLQSPEDKEPGPEYPLGGMVHLSGIGQVRVQWLRDELKQR